MRIAYLYPEHLGHRPARVLQVAATVAGLARAGATVHFVVGRFRGLEARLSELGLNGVPGLVVEPVAMTQKGPGSWFPFSWHLGYHLTAGARLARLLAAGPLVVMVRHIKLAERLLKLYPGLPILYESHEIFADTAAEAGMTGAKLARLTEREARVVRGATRVAAVSRPLAQTLAERFGLAAEPPVVTSGVDDAFLELPLAGRRADLAAYAGSLGWWKGVDLLLEALTLAPSLSLETLGGDPTSDDWRRVADLAAGLNLADRLTMRPAAGRGEVRELLGRAALAVWPGVSGSLQVQTFTSPLKLFEYLASGCAVLAPDTPTARAVVTHGQNAWLVAPGDPVALAQGLEHLAARPELVARLAQAGRELAQDNTWTRRGQRLMAIMAGMSA